VYGGVAAKVILGHNYPSAPLLPPTIQKRLTSY
jgi:hypothetical protein